MEWGLGHAARMIPLALKLREMGYKIFVGAGEEHLSLFRREVPGLTYINFPGFKPGYSKYFPQYLVLLLKTPLLLFHIIREHYTLKKIIRKYSFDLVISDNRFGLWNNTVKTIYITHQPVIPMPKALVFLESIGISLHREVIKKYSYCFIPDLPGEVNLSGRLSHGIKLPVNVRYIGILSRFTGITSDQEDSPAGFRHNTVILSGPEPQRSILKKILSDLLYNKEPVTVFLGGRPDKAGEMVRTGNLIYYDHLPAERMKALITGSECIICRPGYTILMELISLKCTALLIATPGQTEQEYLARYLQNKGWFTSIAQNKISKLPSLPPVSSAFTDDLIAASKSLLDKALDEVLVKIKEESGN